MRLKSTRHQYLFPQIFGHFSSQYFVSSSSSNSIQSIHNYSSKDIKYFEFCMGSVPVTQKIFYLWSSSSCLIKHGRNAAWVQIFRPLPVWLRKRLRFGFSSHSLLFLSNVSYINEESCLGFPTKRIGFRTQNKLRGIQKFFMLSDHVLTLMHFGFPVFV